MSVYSRIRPPCDTRIGLMPGQHTLTHTTQPNTAPHNYAPSDVVATAAGPQPWRPSDASPSMLASGGCFCLETCVPDLGTRQRLAMATSHATPVRVEGCPRPAARPELQRARPNGGLWQAYLTSARVEGDPRPVACPELPWESAAAHVRPGRGLPSARCLPGVTPDRLHIYIYICIYICIYIYTYIYEEHAGGLRR